MVDDKDNSLVFLFTKHEGYSSFVLVLLLTQKLVGSFF